MEKSIANSSVNKQLDDKSESKDISQSLSSLD